MVPEEKWSGIKANVECFRVFGSIAHVHIPEQKRTEIDDRSLKCVLLGVSGESKAYRRYDPTTKKIIVSRDVIFKEGVKWNWNSSTKNAKLDVLAWGDDDNIAAEESEGGETDGEGDSNEEANDRLEEIQEMDESSPELPQQKDKEESQLRCAIMKEVNTYLKKKKSRRGLFFTPPMMIL